MRHTFILARRANMTDDVGVSTEIQVDDETRAALLLFNERVEAKAAKERGTKRVAKAERAKDEAAAAVRKLAENPDASAEAKAEAETAYKAAVASLTETKDDPLAGEQARTQKAEPEEAPTAEAEAPAEEAPTAEATAPAEEAPVAASDESLAETSADEEPSTDASVEAASTPAEAEE